MLLYWFGNINIILPVVLQNFKLNTQAWQAYYFFLLFYLNERIVFFFTLNDKLLSSSIVKDLKSLRLHVSENWTCPVTVNCYLQDTQYWPIGTGRGEADPPHRCSEPLYSQQGSISHRTIPDTIRSVQRHQHKIPLLTDTVLNVGLQDNRTVKHFLRKATFIAFII